MGGAESGGLRFGVDSVGPCCPVFATRPCFADAESVGLLVFTAG